MPNRVLGVKHRTNRRPERRACSYPSDLQRHDRKRRARSHQRLALRYQGVVALALL